MAKEAFYISEKADSLVALHMTTRVCHSKCVVELGERENVPVRPYKRMQQNIFRFRHIHRLW